MAGIYLHIPFCKRRCIYCGFFSSVSSELRGDYVEALCHELAMRRDYAGGEEVHTIYLGGGTPSQLSVDELESVFSCIYKVYTVAADVEVTMEANPDDLTLEYVRTLAHRLPVNRLSMGVQTFDDERLRFLHRRHTSAQAVEAVSRCREAGFSNLSIDLIYGLPGQTLAEWEGELAQALSLRVPHLSAYSLMYEEGTALWRMRESGVVREADEELAAAMYAHLVECLTKAGYEHYEISNFCLPCMTSRHNSSYWQGIPYIGCGAAAHSYDGHSRQWNISSITDYIKGIREGHPLVEREELDLYTRYNDYLVTRLRTRQGLFLPEVRRQFGETLHSYLLKMASPHLRRGLLQLEQIEGKEEYLRLSPEGIFVSDGIISDLLWV